MRRGKRKLRKQTSLKTLILVFVIGTLFLSIGYSYFAQELTVGASMTKTANIGTYSSEFRTNELYLTYEENNWYSGDYFYNYNFTLENVGTNNLSEWYVTITLPSDIKIANSWDNGSHEDLGNGQYKVMGTNLAVGGTVGFGVQLSTSSSNFEITIVDMNGKIVRLGGDPGSGDDPVPAKLPEVSITYTTGNSWNNGNGMCYQTNFTVTNTGEVNVQSWSFTVLKGTGNSSISSAWNCNYVDGDDKITFSGVDFNSHLSAGANGTFGMIYCTSQPNFTIVVGDVNAT